MAYYDIEARDRRLEELEHLEKERHEAFQPIWEFELQLTHDWIIPDLLPCGYLAILAGGPKSGKTSLATQLALCVATGTPFAGMPTVQSSVLWLACEESPAERRLLTRDNPLAHSTTPLYTSHEYLPIDQQTSFDTLDYWLRRTDAKLIVVDPLIAATSGRNLSGGWSARKSLQPLKRFCQQRKVTALVLHHSKPASRHDPRPRVAENDQLSATASMFIVMSVRESYGSRPESPPHAKSMSPGIGVHEGGQGGEIAHHKTPIIEIPKSEISNLKFEIAQKSQLQTPPSVSPSLAPQSREERDEGGGEGLGVRSAYLSELRTPNSESPPKCEVSNLKSEISQGSELRTPPSVSPSLAPQSREERDEGGGEGLGVRSAHLSELRTPNSELSPTSELPKRCISLACRGRGLFANRTINLVSYGPSDYHLADTRELESTIANSRVPFCHELIVQLLATHSGTAAQICTALEINPYTARNALTTLRRDGVIKVTQREGGCNIYTLTKNESPIPLEISNDQIEPVIHVSFRADNPGKNGQEIQEF